MKNTITSLLDQQVQCVLATLGDQQPALHLMAYAFSTDLDEIYIASKPDTHKVRNMRNHPNVTCLWDNRTGNNNDHTQGLAMSGFGKARELTGDAARSIADLLLQRNATLKQLLADPAVLMFAIAIESYQWVEGYTLAMSYQPVKLRVE
ncbi:MAG: nitroimidazol reductase NimA-like FMN-containing flavoprotein [Halioglobus sp.]|jgi:nitroimidazol reductase NimA-like FMN-containing flavoprotein (pyridoxamine 5'-phosphate oxidase superfamily)